MNGLFINFKDVFLSLQRTFLYYYFFQGNNDF